MLRTLCCTIGTCFAVGRMRHGKICEVLAVFVKTIRGGRKWATVEWWGDKDDECEEGPD